MKTHKFIFVVIALFFSTVTSAFATNPFSTASEIRASRQAARGPALQLEYDYRADSSTPAVRHTFLIGADFASLSDPARETVYDFRLRRVITIDPVAKTFSNVSLHALVAFRYQELSNRLMLRNVLESAGTNKNPLPGPLDPLSIESTLGVTDRSLPRPVFDIVVNTPNTRAYRHQGEEWLSVTISSSDAPPAEVRLFYHLLRFTTPIHPDLLIALQGIPAFPAELTFKRIVDGQQAPVTASYHLVSARRVTADYPLLDGHHLVIPFDRSQLMATVGPMMRDVISGKLGTAARTADNYRSAIEREVKSGPDLGTVLTSFEFLLHHGQPAIQCRSSNNCTSIQEVIKRASLRDSRVKTFTAAIQMQHENPMRAVEMWKGLRTDNLPSEDVLNIFAANILSAQAAHILSAQAALPEKSTERQPMIEEAEQLFRSAFEANPYIGSFYKDIGDHMRRGFQADLAWLCYDAGRSVPGSPEPASLRFIDELEDRLVTGNPQFY